MHKLQLQTRSTSFTNTSLQTSTMRNDYVELTIQVLKRGVWESAKEYVVDGETYFHAPAGTRYRIVVAPRFRAVGKKFQCYVDGHKVSSRSVTLTDDRVIVHGFVKHLDGKPYRLEDTLPFQTAPIVNARVENNALPSKIGTIVVKVLKCEACKPHESERRLTAIPSAKAATRDAVAVNLDRKQAAFDVVYGVKSSVGTVLPTTADVGQVSKKFVATLTRTVVSKLTIRYSEDKDMLLGLKPIAPPASPMEVVDLTLDEEEDDEDEGDEDTTAVTTPPKRSIKMEPTVSGHKRSRPEGVIDMVDLSRRYKNGVVSQYLKLSVAWNSSAVDRHMVSFVTPMAVKECRASVRSLPDPRLAELLFRAAEALPPNSSRTKDLPSSLPLWSADGEPLESFEDVVEVKEVVLGRRARDKFKDVALL